MVSGREVVRALAEVGFSEVSQRGSHLKLRSQEGRTVIVPMHRELARVEDPDAGCTRADVNVGGRVDVTLRGPAR